MTWWDAGLAALVFGVWVLIAVLAWAITAVYQDDRRHRAPRDAHDAHCHEWKG